MAVSSNALVDASEVEAYLKGIEIGTSDFPIARLESHIEAISVFIQKYCNNKFIQGDDIYYFIGNNTVDKRLRYSPIVGDIEPTAISYWDGDSWTALDSTVETMNDNEEDEGVLTLLDGSIFTRGIRWRISYTHGYSRANIPADIKDACCELVIQRFKLFDTEKVGIRSFSRADQATVFDFGNLSPLIKNILDKHERYV